MTVHALPVVPLAENVAALLAVCEHLDRIDPRPTPRTLVDLHQEATTGNLARIILDGLDAIAAFAVSIEQPPTATVLRFPTRLDSPDR